MSDLIDRQAAIDALQGRKITGKKSIRERFTDKEEKL